MFCRFFIDRPIFASVLSIVITLAGGIVLFLLPVTQYPEITPPTVEVSAIYSGANAQVVADTVAAPIEQQVNGVEGMLYMSSQCTNDGRYALTVAFRPGVDLDLAQVLVQNRVALAQPVLPPLVQRRGVTVKKKSPTVLMIINLFSPDNSRDNLYLSNYATIQLRDELSRLDGVGDVTFLGQRDYSMRVWLDPDRAAARGVTANDIVRSIEQQNSQVAAGQIGQPPVPDGQVFQFTMTTLGRLATIDQFDDIIVKTDNQGRAIRLKDVARSELGAIAYDQICSLDGKPSVALSIYQLPGSNALKTAAAVHTRLAEMRNRFPDGLDATVVYDTTPFIQESVAEVFHALRDAVILVSLVVLVFLQGWRAAIIPLVAVPVAIVGTFSAMAMFGFSLNTLTLFGLVLAIGIVVDDAIVVVEAIEHHIDLGKSPRDAAIQAMDEVSGPVIAIALVLTAVFVPCTFVTGIIGEFFRQFAVTIAISTIISAFNSLTLSPALAVLLLQPRSGRAPEPLPRLGIVLLATWAGWQFAGPELSRWLATQPQFAGWEQWGRLVAGLLGLVLGAIFSGALNVFLDRFFKAFNVTFYWVTVGYAKTVSLFLRVALLGLIAYGGMLYLTQKVFVESPTGFIPAQDKGYLLVNLRLPDSASLERTEQVINRMEDVARKVEGVQHTVAITGQSLLMQANASNFGSMYVMLAPFSERSPLGLSADVISEKLQSALDHQVDDGLIDVVGAPPIDGLGTAGGFRLMLEDRGDNGPAALQAVSQQIMDHAQETGMFRGLFSSFRANATWLSVELDREAARKLGISLSEIFDALQVNFGSLYVNDFNRFGRTWQVNVQADASYRMRKEDLKRLRVQSARGGMVPLSAVASLQEVQGPVLITRYNLYPTAAINADVVPGVSSGQGLITLKEVAEQQLYPSMHVEWTELALLQQMAGNTAFIAFLLAVVLVFLVLAAQYESWSLPLAVILVVPMCLLCSIVGVRMAAMDVNIFTQIGFVVLVGLACKNAILIVEFARSRRFAGATLHEATMESCRLRLRPIIMTSLAFIFGVIPLMLGAGAGAEMRRTLGTAVFSGMVGVTLFGIFLTPLFFYVIQGFTEWAFPSNRPRAELDPEAVESATRSAPTPH
ncbi:efflux RND transporter permease subunit [Planctomicrobium sp. SH664]|uniref:efflux RND transporter permease subunit n=1 Tax=Planctomicrobium sp. SH664 TaxID=3448125 RepID=UPI003F5B7276